MMKNDIKKYFEEYKVVKEKEDFQFGGAQEFITNLLSLPPEIRYSLISLFEQIEKDSFALSINLPNLDLEKIKSEKEIWENSPKKLSKKVEITEKDKDYFNRTLFDFFEKYGDLFNKLKGYFIFKLENSDESDTNILILYDDDFNKHPDINNFFNDDKIKFNINDYVEEIKRDGEKINKNFICIILITANLRNNEIILPVINELFGLFEKIEFISPQKIPISSSSDYEIKSKDDGIEAISSYSNKIFNNRELSFEEEIIIKKLFEGEELILDYKFIKSGNSGSKVIEIQPSKCNFPPKGRYVVKYINKDEERKLKKEKKSFGECIDGLIMDDKYYAEYVETKTHEAIRYNYASSDSSKESYSFSKILDKYFYPEKYKSEKDEKLYNPQQVLDELFSCGPFKSWKSSINKENKKIIELYGNYVKKEDKILKAVSNIIKINYEDIENSDLIRNYRIIIEKSIETNIKVCHGDLHTENFFKDEKGVYLIDFGWTGRHHAIIDYSTLECSLKYKHLPFYISIDDLIECEKKLLKIDSFDKSFDLSVLKSNIEQDMFSFIIDIRSKAKNLFFNQNSPLEYLISLFFISFRQIQYSELNQRYAYESAKILAEHILKHI